MLTTGQEEGRDGVECEIGAAERKARGGAQGREEPDGAGRGADDGEWARAGRIYATSAGRTVVMVLMCRIAGSGIRDRASGLEGMS